MNSRSVAADPSVTSDAGSLLPVQYAETVRPAAAPEARLMAAVLRTAIADYRRYAADERPVGRDLYRLASEWIAAHDVSWPYSFENICRTFDLDPHAVRRSLVYDRARRERARPTLCTPSTIVLEPRDGSARRVWTVGESAYARGA